MSCCIQGGLLPGAGCERTPSGKLKPTWTLQLARQVLQPDPLPVRNPRPIQFGDAEFLSTSEDEIIVTDDADGIEVT